MLRRPPLLKGGDLCGRSSQREQERNSFQRGDLKEELALLLTELDVRAMSSLEAQKLSRTAGDALQTLTICQDTEEVPYSQLSVRPILVLFENIKTAREAYRLLHSLVAASRPVPKPRRKPSAHAGPQSALLEALRGGAETGDRVLNLQRDAEATRDPDDVRRSAYRRLDSLEETIRELENTLMEISGRPAADKMAAEKPPVPPKPATPASSQAGNNSAVGKLLHSSAASKLKHLQQNATDHSKGGKREDFLKTQGQQQQ